METASEFVLFTALRKVDLHATQHYRQLLPRYTQFGDYMKDYVGLREDPMEVWTSRVLPKNPDAQPGDFLIMKVIFTAQGFMQYATETYSPGTPRFYKATSNGGKEYGAWRFYGGIPIDATDPNTGALLVRIEAVYDWDITIVPA